MTTYEYVEFILQSRNETSQPPKIDEAAVYETAQLVSGSFTYQLYETLWMNDFNMDAITDHLESLYDSGNHYGLVYFVFILANATDFIIPVLFSEMSVDELHVSCLSAAIIEDWFEYAADFEVTEYEREYVFYSTQ